MNGKTRRGLAPVLVLLVCLITTYTVITSLMVIRRSYTPLPFEDSWEFWQRYKYYGNYLAFLFEQHNEHRIVITRLAYLVDRFAFHGRGLFPLVCSLLLQVFTGAGLYRLSRAPGRVSRLWNALLACVICSSLATCQQFENLVLGFQIPFTMVYCASCASLLALTRAAERHEERDVWFALSCVCALAATCASANGLFFWAVLLSFGFWLRLPARYLWAIVLDMILATAFYLRGYVSPPVHGALLAGLIQLPLRAAVFVGSPFDLLRGELAVLIGTPSESGRAAFAAAFGAVGIGLFIWDLILLWRHRDRFSMRRAALVHIAGFVVMTAVLVGFGRASFPMISTLDSRYVTHGMVFWLAMAGQTLTYARDSDPRRLAFGGGVVAIVLIIALRQPYWIRYSKEYAATLRQVQSAIVADVFDEGMWRISYPPSGTLILAEADYLRQNHLSVFTEPWTRWAGRSADGLFVVDANRSCLGAFDAITPVATLTRPGWSVSGWAWDRSRRTGPGIVILLDATRRIAGVVNSTVEREDVRRVIPEVRSTQVGWRGYVSGSVPATLTAYLLEGDGRSLCEIGTR